MQCAGKHRGLGVSTSRVQSLRLDTWSEANLKRMQHGSNSRFRTFVEKHKFDTSSDKSFYFQPLFSEYRNKLLNNEIVQCAATKPKDTVIKPTKDVEAVKATQRVENLFDF